MMLDDFQDRLDQAHNWYNQNCADSVRLLYFEDQAGATAALERAWTDLTTSGMDVETIGYLIVRLRSLAAQIQRIGADPNVIRQSFEQVLEFVEAPDQTELGAQGRLALLIQTRVQLLRDEGRPFGPKEFFQYFDQLDERMQTTEFCLHLASWAYLNRDLSFLGRLFGDYTISPGQYQVSFTWQVINLAHLLLSGRAAEKDLLEMIKVIKHIRQWIFVEKLFGEECRDRGLFTPTVEDALEAKLRQLDQSGGAFAQYETRTQRIQRS